MKLSDFDYELPRSQIALRPATERDHSRLLVLDRATGRREHGIFADLPRHVRPGDALVVNETRVRQARLSARRPSGGRAEFLIVGPHPDGGWEALARPARRLRVGDEIPLTGSVSLGAACGRVRILALLPEGRRRVAVVDDDGRPIDPDRIGQPALPPYIDREPEEADRDRYQTIYAQEPGAIAAPTAGLHFTPALLEELEAMGVEIVRVLLHVGVGTFRAVTREEISEHRMEREFYRYPPEAAAALARTRERGGRVIAVGTTSARVLETVGRQGSAGEGWTELFLHPPHVFGAVDALITNFHLPRSTLLMLVAAFAGREAVLEAYREARDLGYRFYSYGDAMLIL